MKEAKEIYKALEETYSLIKDAGRICIDVGSDIETVNLLIDAKEEISTAKARGAIDYAITQISSVAVEKMEDLDAIISKAGEAAEEGISEPEAEDAADQAEAELRDTYRDKHTNIYQVPKDFESKDEILESLLPAIQATRAGADVQYITNNGGNTATIHFSTGAWKEVNIECDSGIAMIIDICRALM